MKERVFIISALLLSIGLLGCGKKRDSLESMQEPMPIEALSPMGTEAVTTSEATMQMPQTNTSVTQTGLESVLPPQGPYKPAAQEIQTALKNAGYYAGSVDGKIGPMTKKAVENFQKANGLAADGKVGIKTWEVLGNYLHATAPTPASRKKR